jgi:hypothetical protein
MKNVLISEKQLADLIGKVKKENVNENHEQGSYMAKQQLFMLATMAYTMWEKMEDGEQLEDWMESKLAQAEQSVLSVVKAYMYDEFVDDGENSGMGKLNFDELIIGK